MHDPISILDNNHQLKAPLVVAWFGATLVNSILSVNGHSQVFELG
ncbi:hypothetical protein SH449x_005172 [Pirellulaceae bacterium SH449]